MRILFIIITGISFQLQASGQFSADITELFQEGEYFFNRHDYKEAAYYYKRIVERSPDNANFNFKLGECYLNMPGSEGMAVPYFEKAVLHTVAKNKYRRKDITENQAPLHAFFYLGNAYRVENRLEEALKAYKAFINSPFYYGNYNESIVENEIKSCERAKIIQDNPLDLTMEALDTLINSADAEVNPVLSYDEKTLLFVRRLKFYDAVYMSTRVGDSWSRPVNLNPMIGSDGDFYPACLSNDGNELFLVKRMPEGNEIWISVRRDSQWTPAVKLNKKINSGAGESSPWLSSDGKTLYFVSSRKGGAGGTDIYTANRVNQEWGKVRNLGKEINTIFDEESPCLINMDKTLYFSSKGHFSMGGFDIFHSTLNGHSWSDPVNLGYPLNTTSDNTGYIPSQGGRAGYFSRLMPPENSSEDIYHVIIKSGWTLP